MVATHAYRVTHSFPWVGTRVSRFRASDPATCVDLVPGARIHLDDGEVPSLCHWLAADEDDGGGAVVLDRALADLYAPATLTPALRRHALGGISVDETPGSLHPRAAAWIVRGREDRLRSEERFLALVLSQLSRGESPAQDDLSAAWREAGDRPPDLLKDHIYWRFGRPQSPGRRRSPRTTSEVVLIAACYALELAAARTACEADSRCRRNVKDRALTATVQAFGRCGWPLSRRVIQRELADLANRPWIRSHTIP